MKHAIAIVVALAAALTAGVAACETPYRSYSPSASASEPVLPVFWTQPQMVEGQVIRIDSDSYVIRDSAGRQSRVFFDRNTAKDNIMVGDTVIARYDGSPSSPYASSITQRLTNPLPPAVIPPAANLPPHPQTIEGVVRRQSGNDYVIQDLSGREVLLRADSTTLRDRGIRVGDRVVAMTNPNAQDSMSTANMFRLGDPNLVQGDVVWTDGNSYVIRDAMGRDVRLQANSLNDRIAVGDRVIAYTGGGAEHIDSIARR